MTLDTFLYEKEILEENYCSIKLTICFLRLMINVGGLGCADRMMLCGAVHRAVRSPGVERYPYDEKLQGNIVLTSEEVWCDSCRLGALLPCGRNKKSSRTENGQMREIQVVRRVVTMSR